MKTCFQVPRAGIGKNPLATLLIVAAITAAAPHSGAAETIRIGECLAVGRPTRPTRSPVNTRPDPIEAEIVAGRWRPPARGEQADFGDGASGKWSVVVANTNGWFEGGPLRGGYAYAPVVVASDRVMILEAAGHNLAYVNGEPRAGDPYGYDYVHLPVALHAGTNDLLFQCGRGRLKITLTSPRQPIALDLADPTMPDLIAGRTMETWGAVVIVNATAETQTGLALRATIGDQRASETVVPMILPFSARKVGFHLRGKTPRGETASVRLTLVGKSNGGRAIADSAETKLRVRGAEQTQKRTFVSEIDGSVQYWALNPARPLAGHGRATALFLSTHGASVEAIGQADAYSPKTWGNLVAPTNRRPYGFDWEDWGRLDALEVLHLAEAELRPDPQKIYLTGHSMGGHGAWHLGVLFPDQFAAVGPSAGWISFFSYAGGTRFTNATPVEAILQRAAAASDTLLLETNYLNEGVYIIHGGADDNVPVGQARTMNETLGKFHHDLQYHEQPGAGHWWDASDEPGADCVDWAPLFDFFARHQIPTDESSRQVNFATVNPGVSATCHWVEIDQQTRPLERSSINARWDPGVRRFVGATENISLLAFTLNHVKPGDPLDVELDGQKLAKLPWPAAGAKLWLQNDAGHWRAAAPPSTALKGPLRSGPFKDAFRRRMIFVYATKGSSEENAWAFDKARFDAESFWYRGNGSIDVVPDTAFDPRAEPDRGVILYGNADSNAAWPALLAASPVQVHRDEIKLANRRLTGPDLACLFVRPRPGSATACVAVVSGSGLPGMKLTNRLPYLSAGAAYPDCTVIGAEMLTTGAQGVRAAGFFGNDWTIETGDFAWRPN